MNGNPFYIEPANFMQGLKAIGEGLETRAGYMREKAKKKETEELQLKAKDVLTKGTPDEIAEFVSMNPDYAKAADTIVKPKSEKTKRNMAETSLMVLNDPENADSFLKDRAEMLIEEGADASGTIALLKASMEGKTDLVKRLAENGLAYSAPDMFKVYKEQSGMGKEKKEQWIDWGYGKKKNVATGEIATVETKPEEGKWVDWGYGQRKNTKTGKIEKVPVAPRQSSFAAIDREPTKREKDLANMLARNEIDVSQLPKRGDSFNMIVAMAKQINPDMNVRELTSDFALAKNPTFRQKAIVAESVDDIIDEVVRAGKKVDYSNIKAYGSFQKFVKEQSNDPALAEYMTLRNDGLMELAFVMRGAGMTDQAHKAEQEAMNPTMSPRALDAWANAQKRVLKPRLDRYNRITKTGQGKKPEPVGKGKPGKPKSDPLGIR
jgi:hypothetical protein